ncbi:MAG: IclR family transcriptional regulator domain-containing protein [Ferrovibrionaceae bacterium]
MARLRQADAEKRQENDFGPDFSEALARGLTVITAFDAERRQMTLSDVAKAIDLPRATTRRALFTLTRLGYVETDGKLFRLSPRILRLAAAYLTSNAVSTILQPACERLCKQFAEACSAAVLDGQDVVMIAHASPPRFIAVGPGVGFRLPAFCTSLGRVLLGALDDAAVDRFLDDLQPAAPTPRSLTRRDDLRAAIVATRAAGYSLVDQEAELGFRSISVPVQRFDGAVVCAINVGVRAEQVATGRMMEEFLPVLRREASDLKDQLF